MSKWFGKYNRSGYTKLNNGTGSSSDRTSCIKQTTMYTNAIGQAQELDWIDVNRKNKSIIINDDDIVTYAENHETLQDLKHGQNKACFLSGEIEVCGTTQTQVFNPDACNPQTYNTNLQPNYDNTDCDNSYNGILLVDDEGNPIDSTITNNTIYAEIKDTSGNDLDFSWTTQKSLLHEKIYLNSCNLDCEVK